MDELDTFSALLTAEGQELLASLRTHDPADELALATRLRRAHDPALVSAALAQARLRQRARAKFGADAERMYFTPDGVEQATRAPVAAHRAARLRAAGARRVADLCCGNGADALAFARAGMDVLAVDRSPLTCAVARANAEALGLADRVEVRCADVTEVRTDGCDALFLDPARRGGRGRIFDPESYSPPLSWALRAARAAPLAALKVAPGIPHEAVPEDTEAEWVSDGGDVKEAVLWSGLPDGAGGVRATLLPGGACLHSHDRSAAAAGPVGRYLYEPDGAVVRAHLVGRVAEAIGGRLIDPTIAYVTADAPVATEFATAYEITDVLPFNVKKLRAVLRARGIGIVTVKKRGSAVEPEELRRKLKLTPRTDRESCVVFLTRVDGAPSVLLGQPAGLGGSGTV
ncbi:SAM-dependent methyltransferase [Streptomyces sp. NHF165]|uniref:class I SAM-dependent methyltransferase n=1 Tax=Streptomyces sp. NHF165 TaxID=2175864 RepID=UPI00132EF5E9|nr:class I SAM-dependent methyltransferase [Streptomyces sp. NHF165]QHF97483.1 SAM-dependent methyltransferase [Streptomyces sp. NHF165]